MNDLNFNIFMLKGKTVVSVLLQNISINALKLMY